LENFKIAFGELEFVFLEGVIKELVEGEFIEINNRVGRKKFLPFRFCCSIIFPIFVDFPPLIERNGEVRAFWITEVHFFKERNGRIIVLTTQSIHGLIVEILVFSTVTTFLYNELIGFFLEILVIKVENECYASTYKGESTSPTDHGIVEHTCLHVLDCLFVGFGVLKLGILKCASNESNTSS